MRLIFVFNVFFAAFVLGENGGALQTANTSDGSTTSLPYQSYKIEKIYFLGDSITSKDKEGLSYSNNFANLIHKAQKKLALSSLAIENIAVGGSTPAHWDSKVSLDDPNKEQAKLAGLIDGINEKNQLFILTLGGNPLLDIWMARPHTVLSVKMLQRDINFYKGVEHLVNIYKKLLKRGDVMAVKYYHVVPDLGFWGNLFLKLIPNRILNRGADQLNIMVDEAVALAQQWAKASKNPYKIISVCPATKGNYCDGFDKILASGKKPLTKADGVHPNNHGHNVIAKNIIGLSCQKLGHFCREEKNLEP